MRSSNCAFRTIAAISACTRTRKRSLRALAEPHASRASPGQKPRLTKNGHAMPHEPITGAAMYISAASRPQASR